MKSSRINLVMTVIGFGLSIMFIVFVCTRLICARILLIASRRSARSSRSDLNNLERGWHGREPLTPANFPTKKYGELCSSPNESARWVRLDKCVICRHYISSGEAAHTCSPSKALIVLSHDVLPGSVFKARKKEI